jgi:ubiquitin-like-conjugating enzyme ATG10
VHYDILLSPSYRVPVLYFSVYDSAHNPIRNMGRVYDLIVPQGYKEQIHTVGVIGGLSMAVCILPWLAVKLES